MPSRFSMQFDNNPYNSIAVQAYLAAMKKKEDEQKKKAPQFAALNGSMVGRVHFAKPGCGSCGK